MTDINRNKTYMGFGIHSECEEDRAHATIISSKCSRSNRYFKLALADAVQKNTGQGSLEISAWMGKEVVMPILNYGVSFWPDMLDSVGGTPYLKRFRFGGRYVALFVFHSITRIRKNSHINF